MPLRHLVIVLLGLGLAAPLPVDAQLRATLVAGALNRPLGFVQDPSNPAVQYVLEQGGRVRVLVNGVLQAADFLNLTGQIASNGEQGLLGLAFAPDYAASGRVFVSFTNAPGHSVIARYRRSAVDPLRVDPATRFDLVWPDGQAFITQPYANHNGGQVAFGADGYLYFSPGDGGSGNDPNHYAQDPTTLLGKMLRLDVSVSDVHPQGYAAPATNPFVAMPGVRDEIWAFGLRNPWRWSVDDPARGGTGALVIADVGQGAWEEVNYEPFGAGGRNYGWRNREGAHNNVTTISAFSTPLTDPIWEYGRTEGRSITGGFVYRGAALPASYRGRYFVGDFATSRIWSLGLAINSTTGEATVTDVLEHTAEVGAAATSPSSFGVDANGEIYVVSYIGAVYRIESLQPPGPPPSSGGCTTVQPGVDWTCHDGNWLPPGMTPPGAGTPPPPAPPAPPASACPTVQPGPDWTCSNGNWLPPGISPPVAAPPPSSPAPAPVPGACTTVQPGVDWVCYNGSWLPPGMAPPGTSAPTPTTPAPSPAPPVSGGCTTVQPGPNWTCRNGGWLPPGYPGT
jgi:glucose/arabinose dehydrogenase